MIVLEGNIPIPYRKIFLNCNFTCTNFQIFLFRIVKLFKFHFYSLKMN